MHPLKVKGCSTVTFEGMITPDFSESKNIVRVILIGKPYHDIIKHSLTPEINEID